MSKLNKNTNSKEIYIKWYLISYNTVQTFGWSFLLYQVINYFLTPNLNVSLYEHVKWTLIIFQNAAILEVVHATVKFVSSNPVITVQQIASRVMLVCGVLILSVDSRESIGLLLLLVAWSIAEIVRYSNYALNLIGKVPHFLLWLRYTAFIVLYPLGVTGELLCLYAAAQEVNRTKMLCVEMPNSINFTFYYNYFIVFVMLLYIPLFPQMYMHMVTQRKKVLGKNVDQKKLK